MNIGIDFDETITLDPPKWLALIAQMRAFGWKVFVVTYRDEEDDSFELEFLKGKVDGIHFTSRTAKGAFMLAEGIKIDVWIDDSPLTITHSIGAMWKWVPHCNELCGSQE